MLMACVVNLKRGRCAAQTGSTLFSAGRRATRVSGHPVVANQEQGPKKGPIPLLPVALCLSLSPDLPFSSSFPLPPFLSIFILRVVDLCGISTVTVPNFFRFFFLRRAASLLFQPLSPVVPSAWLSWSAPGFLGVCVSFNSWDRDHQQHDHNITVAAPFYRSSAPASCFLSPPPPRTCRVRATLICTSLSFVCLQLPPSPFAPPPSHLLPSPLLPFIGLCSSASCPPRLYWLAHSHTHTRTPPHSAPVRPVGSVSPVSPYVLRPRPPPHTISAAPHSITCPTLTALLITHIAVHSLAAQPAPILSCAHVLFVIGLSLKSPHSFLFSIPRRLAPSTIIDTPPPLPPTRDTRFSDSTPPSHLISLCISI